MNDNSAVIFDIDGTLANITPVLEYTGFDPAPSEEHKEKIMSVIGYAPVNGWVADMARETYLGNRGVIIVTAREEKYRPVTEAWLAANGIHHHELHMRNTGDERPDAVVKRELHAKLSQRWNVEHAVDDNPEVLSLWESLNIDTTVVPGFPYNMGD